MAHVGIAAKKPLRWPAVYDIFVGTALDLLNVDVSVDAAKPRNRHRAGAQIKRDTPRSIPVVKPIVVIAVVGHSKERWPGCAAVVAASVDAVIASILTQIKAIRTQTTIQGVVASASVNRVTPGVAQNRIISGATIK